MTNMLINFFINAVNESSPGGFVLIVIGAIVLIGFIIANVFKYGPIIYDKAKTWFLSRENKRKEEEESRLTILKNQSEILENQQSLHSMMDRVNDLVTITDTIMDRYQTEDELIMQVTEKIAAFEEVLNSIRIKSDRRDDELVRMMKEHERKLSEYNESLAEVKSTVSLLVESDLERFRERLLEVYMKAQANNDSIDVFTFRDIQLGYDRYRKMHGNSWAHELMDEMKEFRKIRIFREKNTEFGEEIAPAIIDGEIGE